MSCGCNYRVTWVNKVCRVGRHYFGVVQAQRTSSNLLAPQHRRDFKVCSVLSQEVGVVEPLRPHVIELYTPCKLFDAVVQEGSRRFDGLEPTRRSAQAHCTACFPCKAVKREGTVEPSRTHVKNSTHLAISVMMWFK